VLAKNRVVAREVSQKISQTLCRDGGIAGMILILFAQLATGEMELALRMTTQSQVML
jgi:hypothetical protein